MNLTRERQLRKEVKVLTAILDCGILSDDEKPIIENLIEEIRAELLKLYITMEMRINAKLNAGLNSTDEQ